MGQAYQAGRFMGQFVIVMIVILLGIPIIIGICAKSWLWLFSSLLVECVILIIVFKLMGWFEKPKLERRVILRQYFPFLK